MSKIGFLGVLFKPTNINSTGGTEVFSANFLEEASKRGYEFDLYASSDSINQPPQINLINLTSPIDLLSRENSYFTNYIKKSILDIKEYQMDLESAIYAKVFYNLIQDPKKYDLIIDNTGLSFMSLNWDLYPKPVIIICHSTETFPHVSLFQLQPIPKNVYFVFPTLRQMQGAFWIPDSQKCVISHGINFDKFEFSDQSDNLLSWFGRISKLKGLEDAITVSKALDKKLVIYGYKDDTAYFDSKIMPLLSENIKLIENNFAEKLHNHSKVLIFSTRAEESFGLVSIEAMACGTPIIAYARGAISEVVQDGLTGFLVNPSDDDIRGDWIVKQTGIEGLKEAVEKVYALTGEDYKQMRIHCREYVEKHFSLKQMMESYTQVFKRISVDSHHD